MALKTQRSAGGLSLARVGVTQEEIAARVGVSRQLVSYWLSGQRTPSTSNRVALRDRYRIPLESWDRPAVEREAPKEAPAASESTTTLETNVKAKAARLDRMLTALLDRVETDDAMTPEAQGKVMASAMATLGLLGKLTGESQEIGESRILRLPSWRRIEQTIVEALEPYPDAMRALGEALKRFG